MHPKQVPQMHAKKNVATVLSFMNDATFLNTVMGTQNSGQKCKPKNSDFNCTFF